MSSKLLVTADIGATFTGMNEQVDGKVFLVFRPMTRGGYTARTAVDFNGGIENGAPADETSTAGATSIGPLVFIGMAGLRVGGTPDFDGSTTPAFDQEIAVNGIRVGYKIYDRGVTGVTHTVSKGDEGNQNALGIGHLLLFPASG